jgi:hypothetical protein
VFGGREGAACLRPLFGLTKIAPVTYWGVVKGSPKKRIGDPRGGWVRGQRRTRFFFPRFIFIVFLNSPHRETPKNVIKKIEKKISFGFLVEFLIKTFRHDFFVKPFL